VVDEPALAADVLDEEATRERFFDLLEPSHFARDTESLLAFGEELGLSRQDDPLTLLRRLNAKIYEAFEYVPQSTRVDSPIDDALAARQGVCQDFAHVMIALVRRMGIPCRYVSGYLFHNHKGSERSTDGASHAWIEAWLPSLGWVGFDPTNKTLATDRHIRVAIGRDYWDVPPNRGAFKGNARSELGVAVRVQTTDAPIEPSDVMPALYWQAPEPEMAPLFNEDEQEQQQQQ